MPTPVATPSETAPRSDPGVVPGRHLLLTVPANTPAAVPTARREVTRHLHLWGLPPDTPAASTAELAVSELMANVVQHTEATTAKIGLSLGSSGELVLVVHDRHPSMPHMATDLDPDQDSGRGLWLVNRLTTESGGTLTIQPDSDGHGKAVTITSPQTWT